MSEENKNVPAVQPPMQIDRSMFPVGDEQASLKAWMTSLSEAPYYKKMGGLPAMMSIVLTGRELGIAPMMSLNGGFFDVQGKIVMSAEMMRAQVFKHGHTITKVEHNEKMCHLKGRRKGTNEDWHEVFTWEDATRAGLTGRDNWKKHPKDMLFASCTRKLCRGLFPDIFGGTADDFEEIDITPAVDSSMQLPPPPPATPATPATPSPEEKEEQERVQAFMKKFNLDDPNSEETEYVTGFANTFQKDVYEQIKEFSLDQKKFKTAFVEYKTKKAKLDEGK